MPFDPQQEYERGLRAVYVDMDARERLANMVKSQGNSFSAADNIINYGLYGSGEGKLSMPFAIIETVFPGSLPASAQTRGDCVSHSTRNAILGSLACEIAAGRPDEVSGKIEGVPEISEAGRLDGVLSTEAYYWWRGHNGDGTSCDLLAEAAISTAGMWLRKDYPEVGIDLTKYSGNLAGKWGSRKPPSEIVDVGKQHMVRTATRVRSFEELRDLIANGYCVSTCGGESWGARDKNGVSPRTRQGWAHALAVLGVDDRDIVTRGKSQGGYGEPLVHVQNSWGKKWNGSENRRVVGTNVDIPLGSFWSRWSDFKNRYMVAFSGLDGWPPQQLDRWFKPGVF